MVEDVSFMRWLGCNSAFNGTAQVAENPTPAETAQEAAKRGGIG